MPSPWKALPLALWLTHTGCDEPRRAPRPRPSIPDPTTSPDLGPAPPDEAWSPPRLAGLERSSAPRPPDAGAREAPDPVTLEDVVSADPRHLPDLRALFERRRDGLAACARDAGVTSEGALELRLALTPGATRPTIEVVHRSGLPTAVDECLRRELSEGASTIRLHPPLTALLALRFAPRP